MEKDTKGIGDNSIEEESKYKTLFETLIDMVLEPKINVDTFLKDEIERARTATRLADKFKALQNAEEWRQIVEERLNTLEHFKQSLNHYKIPYAYMWKRLKQDWGSEIHDYFASKLKDAEEPYGTSWKNKEESNG